MDLKKLKERERNLLVELEDIRQTIQNLCLHSNIHPEWIEYVECQYSDPVEIVTCLDCGKDIKNEYI